MTRTQILKIFIVRSSEQERVRGAEIFKIRVFNLQEHACEVEYEIVRESRTPLPPSPSAVQAHFSSNHFCNICVILRYKSVDR